MKPKFKQISVSEELFIDLNKLMDEFNKSMGLNLKLPAFIEYIKNYYMLSKMEDLKSTNEN